jgi:hypothetical protein
LASNALPDRALRFTELAELDFHFSKGPWFFMDVLPGDGCVSSTFQFRIDARGPTNTQTSFRRAALGYHTSKV